VADDELVVMRDVGVQRQLKGQIARLADGVDQTGRAGKDCKPPSPNRNWCPGAPGAAEEHGIGAVEIVVDLDYLVVLPPSLRPVANV